MQQATSADNIFLFLGALWVNSFLARGLLMTFANSLDHDQDRQNVGPDLDQNQLPSDIVPERNF